MKKQMRKIPSGLAIACICLLSGCGSRVWDNDSLIIKDKTLVKEGVFLYTINVCASPDITIRTTNHFEVGESVKFTHR